MKLTKRIIKGKKHYRNRRTIKYRGGNGELARIQLYHVDLDDLKWYVESNPQWRRDGNVFVFTEEPKLFGIFKKSPSGWGFPHWRLFIIGRGLTELRDPAVVSPDAAASPDARKVAAAEFATYIEELRKQPSDAVYLAYFDVREGGRRPVFLGYYKLAYQHVAEDDTLPKIEDGTKVVFNATLPKQTTVKEIRLTKNPAMTIEDLQEKLKQLRELILPQPSHRGGRRKNKRRRTNKKRRKAKRKRRTIKWK